MHPDDRTETLLSDHPEDVDVTRICGCTFWRERDSDSKADAFIVTWCETHTPMWLHDAAEERAARVRNAK